MTSDSLNGIDNAYLKESNMYDHRQSKISRISEIYYKVIDLIKVLFKKV